MTNIIRTNEDFDRAFDDSPPPSPRSEPSASKEVAEPTGKQIDGKPRLSLVPTQIIFDIAEVREYGNAKYGDPDNWKQVDVGYYIDAAFRHLLRVVDDPAGKDAESGIEHYKHLACNVAFISAMMNIDEKMVQADG